MTKWQVWEHKSALNSFGECKQTSNRRYPTTAAWKTYPLEFIILFSVSQKTALIAALPTILHNGVENIASTIQVRRL